MLVHSQDTADVHSTAADLKDVPQEIEDCISGWEPASFEVLSLCVIAGRDVKNTFRWIAVTPRSADLLAIFLDASGHAYLNDVADV